LEQVLANLLSNAINYTPRGGSIRVMLGHHAAGVWCDVTDSGPGIRPEEVATLFQPFARLSTRPTNGESSSGLGLFLAAELVRLHHGKLTVQSPPAGGTTFRLTLPALPA
jgi:signal transduction histidine kinase